MRSFIYKILVEQKKWTKDLVQQIANQYTTKTEFFKKNQNAYNAAKKYGWFDDVTSHMVSKQIKWTEDMIKVEALKYKTKSEFVKNSPKAADRARYYGIWDDVTKHMDVLGDMFKRLVYVYEFPDNFVYVGLTHDKEERDLSHKIKGPVFKHINETGLIPIFKVVSDDYIDAKDAQNLENCTVQFYENNGWKLLNKAKAGSLGMCKVFWTLNRVKTEALKYKSLQEFREGSPKAYSATLRNNWLKEVTSTLTRQFKEWNENTIKDELNKYTSIKELRLKSPDLYSTIIRKKLHHLLEPLIKDIRRWDDNELKLEALKYNSISELKNNDNSLYVTIISRMGKDFLHRLYGTEPKKTWDENSIRIEASKYSNVIDFRKNNEYVYKLAQKLGILNDIISNMEKPNKWDVNKVTEESKKYKTRMDFKNNNRGAYNAAIRLGIMDQLYPH